MSEQAQKLVLTSPAFKNNQAMPAKYTCDGENVSPELQWSGAPAGTKSFTLIVDDPDAAGKPRVHWLVFNIPATATGLAEATTSKDFIVAVSDFDYMKDSIWQYGGPCPPSGTHHYHFTLYALSEKLDLTADANKDDLLAAMRGHIVGRAVLVGLYQRK